MGKIGDLWIKLGLKKDEFSKGLKEAKSEASGLGSSFGGLSAKVVAFGTAMGNILGNVISKIPELANQLISHSQRMGDVWAKTLNGMVGVWNQFLTSVTSWNWDNFWGQMSGAFRGASESTAAHDREFEVENAIKIRKGQMQNELEMLRIETQNATKSYQERAAAAQQYLDKVRPLYEDEIRLRKEIRLADLNEYLGNAQVSQTAANRQNLESFLTDIAPNSALVKALDNYSKKNRGARYSMSAEDERLLDAFFAQYGAVNGGAIATIAEYYQSTGDSTAKKVTDAILDVYAAEALFNQETRRIQTALNTANFGISKEGVAGVSGDAETESTLDKIANDFTYIDAIIRQCEKDMLSFGDVMDDIEFTDSADANIEAFLAKWNERQKEIEAILNSTREAIAYGLSDGIQEFADQLMGLSEVNMGAVLQSLLSPLADMAIREGEIIVAAGIGLESLKKSLESLNGAPAVAAGVALIAIGSAAKAGLAALAQKGGSSSSGTNSYSGSSATGTASVNSELTVYVKGKLSGSDIVLSGQKTMNQWSR